MTTINPSFNAVSQLSHVAWGYLLVTLPVLLFHVPLIWSAGIIIVAAGIKEYWDAHGLETIEVAGNSWEDFGSWCVGITIAILTLTIKL